MTCPGCGANRVMEWAGGDLNCDHNAACAEYAKRRAGGERKTKQDTVGSSAETAKYRLNECPKCGAVRAARPLGMEDEMDCLAWSRGDPPCTNCYVCRTRTWAAAVWRVLRPDGVFWLNVGDSFYSCKSRFSSAPQTMSGKARDEPTNGQKIDFRGHPWIRDKMLANVPGHLHSALQMDGWIVRQRVKWHKDNGMPESSPDRPTTKHEDVIMLVKSGSYWFDNDAIRKPYDANSFLRAKPGAKNPAKEQIPLLNAEPDAPPRPAVLPSEESKQNTRPADDGGAGKGLQRARVADANRRGDVATAREALDNGGICAHPLGAVRGTIWAGPTAQFRGRDSEHYAVGPTWLAVRAILAAAPERTCPSCGVGWMRLSWVLAAARRRASSRLKKSPADRPTVEGEEVSKLQHGKSQSFRTFRKDGIGRGGPVRFCALIPNKFAHLAEFAAELANLSLDQEVHREDIEPFGAGKNAHLHFAPTCTCAGGMFSPDNPPPSAPGLVCDPFTGVGTTAVAAGQHGRDFVGSELSPNYRREAEARLAEEVGKFQPSLAI